MRRTLTDSERDGINAMLALSNQEYLFWITAERCKHCGAPTYRWRPVDDRAFDPRNMWCPWWCALSGGAPCSTIVLMRRMIEALNNDATSADQR